MDEKPVKQRATRVERITMEDGRAGWLYSDGSKRDEKGQLMETHPNAGGLITVENSAAYHRARREKFMERSSSAFVREMRSAAPPGEKVESVYDAFGVFVAHQAAKVEEAEKPHPQGAEFVAKAIGAFPHVGRETDESPQLPTNGLFATGETGIQLAEVLREALRSVKPDQTIDAD